MELIISLLADIVNGQFQQRCSFIGGDSHLH